jgi:hypothetical protein
VRFESISALLVKNQATAAIEAAFKKKPLSKVKGKN